MGQKVSPTGFRLGITEEDAERVKPSLNNESYTSYMRAVAAEEGPAEIMAAVLSCALSYEYIAKWIVANYPNADQHEFYGEWVRIRGLCGRKPQAGRLYGAPE